MMQTNTLEQKNGEPIDLDALLARCMGRVELMERMLSNFKAHTEQDIQFLITAIQAGDGQEIGRLAHKLKGTSLTVSAVPLANTADRLQHLAIDPTEPDLKEDSWQLLREYQLVVEQLESLKLTRGGNP